MAQNDNTDFTEFFEPGNTSEGPLTGLRAGIKDLFDVAGYVTRAGSRSREMLPPANEDADAVARLRVAGASLVGHNNMTEFAYSGLGLNPHFGTPMSPLVEGGIAGGSTSGGAAALAKGDIDIALGTDTGGSLRIPAAFCGVVGFKPTAASVSSSGALALSHSLDSVGPMARDVATVKRIYDVLRQDGSQDSQAIRQLIVPQNFGMDQVDDAVSAAFEDALSAAEACGFQIQRRRLDFLDLYATLPVWHFSAVESRVHHARQYAESADLIDPRVRSRMDRADTVSAVEYAQTLELRGRIIQAARTELGNTAIVLPTVAIMPPQLAKLQDDDEYNRLNLLALRNTTLANVCDGCSISLPITQTPGTGLMLTAPAWRDLAILEMATRIEPALKRD